MWVVADLDDDYIAKMEDGLEVYEPGLRYPTTGDLLRRETDHFACRPAASSAGGTGTGSTGRTRNLEERRVADVSAGAFCEIRTFEPHK
jgi:hypothetical protein